MAIAFGLWGSSDGDRSLEEDENNDGVAMPIAWVSAARCRVSTITDLSSSQCYPFVIICYPFVILGAGANRITKGANRITKGANRITKGANRITRGK